MINFVIVIVNHDHNYYDLIQIQLSTDNIRVNIIEKIVSFYFSGRK